MRRIRRSPLFLVLVGCSLLLFGSAAFVSLNSKAIAQIVFYALADLDDVSAKTGTGTVVVMQGSPTITTPTIASFTNAQHTHADGANGGTLSASAIATGNVAHERGGLEADVSAYSGYPKITGGSTTEVATIPIGDGGTGATTAGGARTAIGADDAANITTGVLTHERGGLEADVSAGDGYVEVKGGATTVRKSNLNASVDPTVNEDSGDGYSVGSEWINTTDDKTFTLVDATVGAAVWKETSAAGGGGISDGDKGDISVSSSGSVWNIDPDAVGAPEISAGAVDTSELADNAVTGAKMADTAVTPGSYTNASFTVDQQGRLTAASSGTGADQLGLTASSLQTGNNTGSVGQIALLDASSASFTQTFPPTPSDGNIFGAYMVTDPNGNEVAFNRNGSQVDSSTDISNTKAARQGDFFLWQYKDLGAGAPGWMTISEEYGNETQYGVTANGTTLGEGTILTGDIVTLTTVTGTDNAVSLPAIQFENQSKWIENKDSADTAVVFAASTQTIDGGASFSLPAGVSILLVSEGTDWRIKASHGLNASAASESAAGIVELATGAETNTGTDNTRAVTPDGLDDWTGSPQITAVGTLSSGNADAAVTAASDTVPGKVELATIAETNTGTDTTRAVTPDGLDGWTGSPQVTTVGTLSAGNVDAAVTASSETAAGKIEIATTAEVNAGTDNTRAVTPAGLAAWTGGGGGGLTFSAYSTDADLAMAVNTHYFVDISGWTSDHICSLPTTAAQGSRIRITLTAGDDAFEAQLRTTAASGDTINGVDHSAADLTKLFITAESMEFTCVTADSAWVVSDDDRIPCRAALAVTTATVTDNTLTTVDFDTASPSMSQIGNIIDATNQGATARRDGTYVINAAVRPNSSLTASVTQQVLVYVGGTARGRMYQNQSSVSAAQIYPVNLSADVDDGETITTAAIIDFSSGNSIDSDSNATYLRVVEQLK